MRTGLLRQRPFIDNFEHKERLSWRQNIKTGEETGDNNAGNPGGNGTLTQQTP